MGYSFHKRYRPRPDWLDSVEVGDVLLIGASYRVVRKVSRAKTPRPEGVNWRWPQLYFAIKRCSWTGRAYTIYTANDLQTMGAQHTGARVSLEAIEDHALLDAIESARNGGMEDKPWRWPMTCCTVADMP